MATRKRFRLVFEVDGAPMTIVRIDSDDKRAVDDAVAAFRSRVREALAAGGCRSFLVGVHVEGAECDHNTGP